MRLREATVMSIFAQFVLRKNTSIKKCQNKRTMFRAMLTVEQNCEQNCSFVLFFEFYVPIRRQKQEQNRNFCFQFCKTKLRTKLTLFCIFGRTKLRTKLGKS